MSKYQFYPTIWKKNQTPCKMRWANINFSSQCKKLNQTPCKMWRANIDFTSQYKKVNHSRYKYICTQEYGQNSTQGFHKICTQGEGGVTVLWNYFIQFRFLSDGFPPSDTDKENGHRPMRIAVRAKHRAGFTQICASHHLSKNPIIRLSSDHHLIII